MAIQNVSNLYQKAGFLAENPNPNEIDRLAFEAKALSEQNLSQSQERVVKNIFFLLEQGRQLLQSQQAIESKDIQAPYSEKKIEPQLLNSPPSPLQEKWLFSLEQAAPQADQEPLISVAQPTLFQKIWNLFVHVFYDFGSRIFIREKESLEQDSEPNTLDDQEELLSPHAFVYHLAPIVSNKTAEKAFHNPQSLGAKEAQKIESYQGTVCSKKEMDHVFSVLYSLWRAVEWEQDLSLPGFVQGFIDHEIQNGPQQFEEIAIENLGIERSYIRELQRLDRYAVIDHSDEIIAAVLTTGEAKHGILIDQRDQRYPRYYHFNPHTLILDVCDKLQILIEKLQQTPIELGNPFTLKAYRIKPENEMTRSQTYPTCPHKNNLTC